MAIKESALSIKERAEDGGWGTNGDCRFQMAMGQRREMEKITLRTRRLRKE